MKHLLCALILLLIVSCAVFAQSTIPGSATAYKKRPTLVIHFVGNDFQTAERIRQRSLGDVLKDKQWTKAQDWDYGLGFQFLQGLTKNIDFSARLDGTFTDYLFRNRPQSGSDDFLLETDAGFNIKLLSDRYVVVPYLHAGIGGSMYSGSYFAAYAPLGAGLQFNLGKGDAFVFSNAQYRVRITENASNHFNFNIGVGGALTSRREADILPPPPPPVAADTDGDDINDNNDSCITVPGVAKYNGCPVPDSDSDGINDDNDKCPNQAGLAKYNGCPIPDSDNDGINDEEDRCPNQAGVAKYFGCPIPDTDGDGVNDEEDKCPNAAGPARNGGCPEKAQIMQSKVDTTAHQIFFATGSATLLSKSYKPLNGLATLLKQNTDLGIDIEGHTDNTGTDAINIKLSQRRAEAVMKYLRSKGVTADRMTAKGYGSSLPIEDNSTAAGRAMNRRVELKLRQL
jgi:outer membrane protein OmpA-like peptidoglycan-associated protein